MAILTASDSIAIHHELMREIHGTDAQGTIVLLHGLSQQRHFWRPVIAAIDPGVDAQVIAVDQRGHGDSDSPLDSDFSIERCALDVVELVTSLHPGPVTIVGHSWGASVALRSAAILGESCSAAVLIDGGVFGPAMLGDRDVIRERLRPPELGLPLTDLMCLVRAGDLGPFWSPAVEDALRPTFTVDDKGLARTRLGVPRHMRVLEGMFEYLPDQDIATLAKPENADLWVVGCDPLPSARDDASGWQGARERAYQRVGEIDPTARVLRWTGAIHDVPLQWPALVGGLIQTAHENGARDRRAR